jgi:hypothetical protein
MHEAKTRPTAVPVETYIAAITDEARRADCRVLMTMMQRVTGALPAMWGSSIVGFGSYHYKYASGHEGETCLVGFSSGKAHMSIYLLPGFETEGTLPLLNALGRHKRGKGCLNIKRLADVELPVLEQLVADSVAHVPEV